MFSKREYILVFSILLFPLVPSFFLSGNIDLKNFDTSNDPFRKTISDFDPKEVLWLDARSSKKYEMKHIPGAVLVNAKDWEASLGRLFEVFQPGQTIVVYCNKGCSSSRAVASRLRDELGQENVYYLDGGMDIWFKSTSQ